MTQPFFSIITICRNEERDIRLTADSVVKQTYKNYEWLVLDGASTDKTLKILQKYKKNMGYFISEKDNGVYDAMNKCIKKATGKYLIFMNGGDLFAANNVLKKTHDFIKADKQSCPIYHGEAYTHNNNLKNMKPNYYRPSLYRRGTATPFLLYRESLPHQCCFVRKEMFEKYGLYDTSFVVYGDREWFSRTKKEKNKFMNFFVAIQNQDDWKRRLSVLSVKRTMQKELKTIHRKHFNPLQVLFYKTILLPPAIYNHWPFLHKAWWVFKKIINIKNYKKFNIKNFKQFNIKNCKQWAINIYQSMSFLHKPWRLFKRKMGTKPKHWPIHLYYLMPFLHKPWRVFKKMIGIKK